MGGGSGGRRAERAARDEETQRQATIAEGSGRINAAFDAPERGQQINSFLAALRERYTTDANRQKGTADRRSKFALARSGLTGGSRATDAKRVLGEEYTAGILNAENQAQSAVGDLRGQDEQSRLQLLGQVRSGLDTTTAAQRAGEAIRANAQGVQGRALAGGLGDIFGATADTYRRSEEAAERRRGAREAYGTVYGSGAASPFRG